MNHKDFSMLLKENMGRDLPLMLTFLRRISN